MADGSNRSMTVRMFSIICVIVLLFFGAASVNLVKIMIVNGEDYKAKAAAQQLSDTTLSAKRGDIYDCNYEVLATSATAWTVYITPQDIETEEERKTIAKGLSEILELDYDKVYKQTQKKTYYEKIKSRIEKTVADKVRTFISEHKLGSIVGLDETTKRYYPNNSLASTVLGFVGTDNQGLSGLESYYDENLAGTDGRVRAAKNARGADMPFSYEKIVEAQTGNSLVLTIDKYIQYVAEKYLEKAVEENNVTNRGCVVAMDPNTGGILAMATKPDFDPNTPFAITDERTLAALEELKETEEYNAAFSKAQKEQWRNKAISDTYEPGSVFKVVTGSAALEEDVVFLSNSFSCPGYIVIAGTRYSCHKHAGHGTQSLGGAFANSCNPAFIQIGQSLGVKSFFKYFQSYGLTEKTGIDLPGETSPIAGVTYHDGSTMTNIDLASESFGQGFNVTPIQLITAISAAVNGGYLVQPHVVSKIVDVDNNTVKNYETKQKRQVISTETSELICTLLESVVSKGSGKNAYVPGYSVGGKTGTSQKLSSEDTSARVASFCGFAPTDNPQIVVLVVLDEPHGPIIYGGTIAAPVAGSILSDVLPYMGIEPTYTDEELSSVSVSTPDVTAKTVADAKNAITAAGLSVRVVGNGDTVQRQMPSAGQPISKSGTVVIYTGAEQSVMIEVPDFTGKTVAQANALAAEYKLNIKFSGYSLSGSSIVAYSQSIEPGVSVEIGSVITVSFRASDGSD